MERVSASKWAERVRQLERSGLTAEEFASQRGLKLQRLTFWRWKLQRDGLTAPRGRGALQRASVAGRDIAGAGPKFVELPTATLDASGAELELVLACGVTLRVPNGFDEQTLKRVLRAVEASR